MVVSVQGKALLRAQDFPRPLHLLRSVSLMKRDLLTDASRTWPSTQHIECPHVQQHPQPSRINHHGQAFHWGVIRMQLYAQQGCGVIFDSVHEMHWQLGECRALTRHSRDMLDRGGWDVP